MRERGFTSITGPRDKSRIPLKTAGQFSGNALQKRSKDKPEKSYTVPGRLWKDGSKVARVLGTRITKNDSIGLEYSDKVPGTHSDKVPGTPKVLHQYCTVTAQCSTIQYSRVQYIRTLQQK